MSPYFDDESLLRLLADCIQHGSSLDNIKTVIRNGADPNGRVHKGLRPLHYAAFVNSPSVIITLVENGADVNVADDVGYTPLHIAAKHGHYEAVKALIDSRAVVDFIGDKEQERNAAPEVCQALAELTMNPLNLALENNHPKVAELLIHNGAQANQLYFLGYEINLVPLENVECLEVLLKNGANPDSYSRAGLTTLMKACKQGDVEAAKVLIQYGADINIPCGPKIDQKRAIHYAVLSGNKKVTVALLEAGAILTKPPEFKYAPLEYAITQDKIRLVKTLLEYGANPNEINDDGCTPLQVACSTPELTFQKEAIELLLENGADPNLQSTSYSYVGPSLAPIVEYLAYFRNYDEDVIKVLLKYGAEVHFVPATKYFKIINARGILYHIRKLKRYPSIMSILLEAAGSFSRVAINEDKSGMSEEQKILLLDEAKFPRTLMHQTRLCIRRLLKAPKPPQIDTLPVPPFLRKYLQYFV